MSSGSENVREIEAGAELRQRVAERTARPMFVLSVLFLVMLAAVIVLCVDVWLGATPEATQLRALPEPQTPRDSPAYLGALERGATVLGPLCLVCLLLLWTVFVGELAFLFVIRDRGKPFWKNHLFGLSVCFCPPLRMCSRNHAVNDRVWLPWLGWQDVNDALRDRLEKSFSVPMIVIALMILPVLLVEWGLREQMGTRIWLRAMVHLSTGLIWFAFATEFIVMFSLAEKRLRYCRQHWLDLVIILLPLVSFLRTLRVVRATRVARLAKLQQLSKMSRLYRLRGLAMRGFRAVLLLELLNRILGVSPDKRLRKLRDQLHEKEREVDILRREIARLEEAVVCAKGEKPPE